MNKRSDGRAWSGEHRPLACWFWQLAKTNFRAVATTGQRRAKLAAGFARGCRRAAGIDSPSDLCSPAVCPAHGCTPSPFRHPLQGKELKHHCGSSQKILELCFAVPLEGYAGTHPMNQNHNKPPRERKQFMKSSFQITKPINPISASRNRSPWPHGLLIPLLVALACLAFSAAPNAFGVNPPPDGGYPNQNTAEGEDALFSLVNGINNAAIGWRALYLNTDGHGNTAAGSAALYNNTTGDYNTANGVSALYSNTTGNNNTATGVSALAINTTGSNNTANGVYALLSNEAGTQNTATGAFALQNSTGSYNTATGFSALNRNTTGNSNTADGVNALYSNITGGLNTANGDRALFSNTTGNYNTATGGGALFFNLNGTYNTAQGVNALYNNTIGLFNTANGASALFRNTTGRFNTAQGVNALYNNTTGGNNIALGLSAGQNLTTGSNNIDIGNAGVAAESNTIRIGTAQIATFIAGISGKTAPGGVGVVVAANGKLGTVVSSKRFKEEIKPMEKDSEAILALKPVTFRYKQEIDPEGIPQFGLVAEEVEKVNPALVARDEKGKAYTVRYEAINAMLLNEFLKEHRKVEQQEAAIAQLRSTVAQQQKGMEVLTTQLTEQAKQIQKVSAQIEVRKAEPQRVVNNP